MIRSFRHKGLRRLYEDDDRRGVGAEHGAAALEADRFHYRGPNCENYPDMINRVRPFLDELLANHEDCVAVVSHGMIGRVMVAQLLGLNEQQTLAFHQDNDVIFHLTIDGDAVTACHYIGGDGPHPGLGQ